jgi:hypothetical protein
VTMDGSIIVVSDYTWAGTNNLGDFAVYVDGGKVRSVAPESSVAIRVESGSHLVRVRLWWFSSKVCSIDVPQGGSVRLRTDVPRRSAFRRYLTMLFIPLRSLDLKAETPS